MSEARMIPQEPEEEEEAFEEVAILDDASAEMELRRIKRANEQYERMEAWYEHQLAKAREIRDRTIAFAENNLRGYFEMVPTKNTKTQRSYELPSGKLVLKAQQPEYERDEDALCGWLKGNGLIGMVKVKESANWAELKKMLTEGPDGETMMTPDGEIVPGIKVVQRDPKFTVTVK